MIKATILGVVFLCVLQATRWSGGALTSAPGGAATSSPSQDVGEEEPCAGGTCGGSGGRRGSLCGLADVGRKNKTTEAVP